MTDLVRVSPRWLASCGLSRFEGLDFEVTRVTERARIVFFEVIRPDGQPWTVANWTGYEPTVTPSPEPKQGAEPMRWTVNLGQENLSKKSVTAIVGGDTYEVFPANVARHNPPWEIYRNGEQLDGGRTKAEALKIAALYAQKGE